MCVYTHTHMYILLLLLFGTCISVIVYIRETFVFWEDSEGCGSFAVAGESCAAERSKTMLVLVLVLLLLMTVVMVAMV